MTPEASAEARRLLRELLHVDDDRITLPPQARLGDRLVASFDPGSRVDAIVVARAGRALGSVLDLDSIRHSPPAEVSWACGILAEGRPDDLPST